MKEMLQKVLERNATTRTKRYFLRDFLSDSSSNNAAKLCDVVTTTDALRKFIGNSNYIASSGGGDWSIRDYQVPSFLNIYINTGKIYLSEVYFKRRAPLLTFENEELDAKKGKILTPTEFNETWDRYNENQGNEMIPLEYVEEDPIYLSDLSVLIENEKNMYILGTGRISRELAYFCRLACDGHMGLISDLKLSTTYCPSEDEVIDSLFLISRKRGNDYAGGTNTNSESLN